VSAGTGETRRRGRSDSSMAGWPMVGRPVLEALGSTASCTVAPRADCAQGRADFGPPRRRFGGCSVQGAATSVDVAQSRAAKAATLRGCPMGSGVEGSALKGNKAQGSIERADTGNRVGRQRILWRSKAMRSSTTGRKRQVGQRRDGNGRGDAARLPGRERLRRV